MFNTLQPITDVSTLEDRVDELMEYKGEGPMMCLTDQIGMGEMLEVAFPGRNMDEIFAKVHDPVQGQEDATFSAYRRKHELNSPLTALFCVVGALTIRTVALPRGYTREYDRTHKDPFDDLAENARGLYSGLVFNTPGITPITAKMKGNMGVVISENGPYIARSIGVSSDSGRSPRLLEMIAPTNDRDAINSLEHRGFKAMSHRMLDMLMDTRPNGD